MGIEKVTSSSRYMAKQWNSGWTCPVVLGGPGQGWERQGVKSDIGCSRLYKGFLSLTITNAKKAGPFSLANPSFLVKIKSSVFSETV
jgi:hypothetical protein